ncbi:MAG: proline dehydrogenase family protein [Deltaproteobacteria bacterium]|nr:proline dehydrogenase family protein [Deltaproteobacteria bacterium]MCX7952597.1 proline dehydrogenase family protein [Deltaproteobacteria bacterium]
MKWFFVNEGKDPISAILNTFRFPVCLDVLGESSLSVDYSRWYLDQNVEFLEVLPSKTGDFQLALKPSAFVDFLEEAQVEQRFLKLIHLSRQKQVPVIFDAEIREVNEKFWPILCWLAKNKYNVGCALQCYWTDAKDFATQIINLNPSEFEIRLVKGAYYKRELEKYPNKVCASISETTRQLIDISNFVAQNTKIKVAVGTHDLDVIKKLMLSDISRKIEFQVLYGVGNGFARYLKDLGFQVRLYTPFSMGRFDPTPYLIRRAQENTNPFGFVRKLLHELV